MIANNRNIHMKISYLQPLLLLRGIFSFVLGCFCMVLVACGGGGGGTTNSAPTASNVTILDVNGGDAVVGDSLTGSYSYDDADADIEGASTFQWLRDGVAISGATTESYTLTSADNAQTITFEVTPVAVTGASPGSAATSSGLLSRLAIFTTFQAADVVIGQADFSGQDDNQGGSAGGNTLAQPYGNPGVADGVLYLPDTGNNRLLGFDAFPVDNNSYADFVLGQPDFTTNNSGVSSTNFWGPQSVAFDSGKMFLSSYESSRILIWNTTPTSTGIAADVVLGQSDFVSSNATPCSASGISGADAIWAVNDKLIMADYDYNRVLIWNTIPSTNTMPADVVLGQQDFTHCAANDADNDGVTDSPGAQTLYSPSAVWSDGSRLVVLDVGNNRALIWNTFPTSNFTAADVVLGQSNFTNNASNNGGTPTAETLNDMYTGVYSNGTQLFIADPGNHRILIWNTFPTSNFAAADVVLGQNDFIHNSSNDHNQDGVSDGTPTANTLNYPAGVFQSGRQLIVSDSGNNRYLIFNGQ